MRSIRFLSGVVFAGLVAVSAQAATRTFVSATSGSDANPCSRALPCRTFAFALTLTDAGGEIDTLDPGGYGPLTISKAVSIVSGLGEAGVLVPLGSTGIMITAGPSDAVNLRGLVIEGAALGSEGVRFASGKSLTMTDCVVRNVTGTGIVVSQTVQSRSSVAIVDTLVSDNDFGIYFAPQSALTASLVLDRVTVVGNLDDGLTVDDNAAYGAMNTTATDCTFSNNGRYGVDSAAYNQHATTYTVLSRCAISNNASYGVAVQGGGPGTLRFGGSVVSGNLQTFYVSGGMTLTSYGDNAINGNADGDPAPPLAATK